MTRNFSRSISQGTRNHWMYFGGYCKWPAIPKIHHQDCVLQIIRKFNLSVNLAVRCPRYDVMNALLWMVHYFSRFISRGNLNHWMYFDGYCKVTSNGQDTSSGMWWDGMGWCDVMMWHITMISCHGDVIMWQYGMGWCAVMRDDGMGWCDVMMGLGCGVIMGWDGMGWCDAMMGCDDVMWYDDMMWCNDGMRWDVGMGWCDVMMGCGVMGWDIWRDAI